MRQVLQESRQVFTSGRVKNQAYRQLEANTHVQSNCVTCSTCSQCQESRMIYCQFCSAKTKFCFRSFLLLLKRDVLLLITYSSCIAFFEFAFFLWQCKQQQYKHWWILWTGEMAEISASKIWHVVNTVHPLQLHQSTRDTAPSPSPSLLTKVLCPVCSE